MEDAAIIDLYWQRSEAAIAETANKYGAYCSRIAFNILHNDADAEECVNDAYLGAWNAMPSERPALLRSFVGKITRNLSLSRFDYNHAERRNANLTVVLSELEECLSGKGVEADYAEKQTVDAINCFLTGLGATERCVFVRRYWYVDTVKEVAVRFGISESKTKSMLFRLRGKLREYLREAGIMA